MRHFAEDWNFKITTTSPHYPKSNGQAECAIQTVKGLLRKAEESGGDPNIALLQYRNSSIAGCTFSPAQLAMNRQLRTRIPVSSELLHSLPVDPRELVYRQQKYKRWYDRGAKDLEPLHPGDVVRVRHNDQWQRGFVSSQHETPRSYIVETEYGSTLRRNRRDLIHTREDPPPSTDPPCDDVESGPATVPPSQSSSSEPPPESAVKSSLPSSKDKRTRCGRMVKLPVRFED